MPLNGAEVPQLILIQPFGLAFLVIDFHRPAMASNAGDAGSMPGQAVANVKGWIVREIRLAIVDHQALSSKVVQAMDVAITVIDFMLAFEGDTDALEDGVLAV